MVIFPIDSFPIPINWHAGFGLSGKPLRALALISCNTFLRCYSYPVSFAVFRRHIAWPARGFRRHAAHAQVQRSFMEMPDIRFLLARFHSFPILRFVLEALVQYL